MSVATSIQCPDCRSEIAIQPPKPGRFRSKCPKCSSFFAVTVPEGAGATPVVSSLGPLFDSPSGRSSNPILPEASPDDDSRDPDETVTQEFPRHLVAVVPPKPAEDDETIEEFRPPTGPVEPPFQPPRSLGGYRIGRRLGLIRVGAAFEARRTSLGPWLALAVVRPRWAAEAPFVSRFAREAFAAGLLDHPNLIPPLDLGVNRGFVFVASEALVGESLGDNRGRQGLDRTARASAILYAARASGTPTSKGFTIATSRWTRSGSTGRAW